MSRPAFWIALLALASLFFGWQTYKAGMGPVLPAGASIPQKPPVPEEGGIPKAAAPAAAPVPIASITARPLFRPDRRPFLENAAVAPRRNYEAELSRFTVLGVVLIGTSEKAIVTRKTGSREERFEVGPGESLGDFTVKELGPDGLVLVADERQFSLPLYAGAPKGVGGALRTEVPLAPARAPVQPQPAPVAPTPGTQPAAVAPTPAPGTAPSPVPPRTFPRRYIPGRR